MMPLHRVSCKTLARLTQRTVHVPALSSHARLLFCAGLRAFARCPMDVSSAGIFEAHQVANVIAGC